MDVEKCLPAEDHTEEITMEVTGNPVITSSSDISSREPGADGQYRLASTPERRRISEELHEGKRLELE
jgi:hypothetical protein